jgi:hypothetical protein
MLRPAVIVSIVAWTLLIAPFSPEQFVWAEGLEKNPLLTHTADAPRRSEGDFVQLRDGRILFVYSKFTGRSDFDASQLASRVSSDGGRTWSSDDLVVLENEGKMNTMSVSLNRLADSRIAMFYARKNSLQDCRPYVRFSTDEAATWSPPVEIIPDSETGYYVLNNDRVVQLKSGRLVVPVAWHANPVGGKFESRGVVLCYLSDDGGRSWRRGKGSQDGTGADGNRVTLQEPGVVELNDGRLLMFCRTNARAQFYCYSSDGGETWSVPKPSTLVSPQSPATTGDLLCVWNDHAGIPIPPKGASQRTPLKAALSRDEGLTWTDVHTLEGNRQGYYCYVAMEFVGDQVLLGYCASDLTVSKYLADTQITRFPIQWLYELQR